MNNFISQINIALNNLNFEKLDYLKKVVLENTTEVIAFSVV